MVDYREENRWDRPGVRAVVQMAFGRNDEVQLIDRLWAASDVIASLVAVDRRVVVGHILFSRLPIETEAGTVHGAALAPLSVRPDCQRQGIGSKLVDLGVETCGERGVEAIVVVGHPDFYPRLGFSAITAERLQAPFSGPAFMAMELISGVLTVNEAKVRYPSAFGLSEG